MATKVKNQRSVGIDRLRLKIAGTPARRFVDPTRKRETCDRDQGFADALRAAEAS